jgi:hypothetical protein
MADERKPFAMNTRKNIQYAGFLTFAAGQAVSLLLPKVGYLSALYILFDGSLTLSGAGSLADSSPWALFNRISLSYNLAAAKVIDLTGYDAFLVSSKIEPCFRPDAAGIGATTPHATQFVAPVASGANTAKFGFKLPCAANGGDNFDAGLINLQAPEIQCSLDVLFGAVTDYAALATAGTGTAHVYVEYFEVPDPRTVMQPPQILHRVVSDLIPVTATGDNVLPVVRQGTMLQMINTVRLNGARSESYDSHQLVFNKTTYPYRQDRRLLRFQNRMQNGFDWPTGVFDIDLWHSSSLYSAGGLRDAIDNEELANFDQIITVTSGATLGSGNNSIATVRRFLQVVG